MKDLEVMTFRRNILDVCKSSIEKRQRRGKASQALYVYPPDLESSPTLPSHLQDKIRDIEFIYGNSYRHSCENRNKNKIKK
jgi:hypothetical protein